MANHADRQLQVIEDGDIEEAMNAAAKIGDYALQKQSQGYGAGVPLPTVHLRNG
jgi:predicted metalloprotease